MFFYPEVFRPRVASSDHVFFGEPTYYQPFAADYEASVSDVGLWLSTAVPWRPH